MTKPHILLIVTGGIAAYKSCELVRALRRDGCEVTCVLTAGGAQFVTAMTLAALSGNRVHSALWDAGEEAEIGHIELSRAADLLVVCPASANILAKMAAGIADDLATTLLLATDKPVLAVPAMNVRMWQHPATCRNIARLGADGIAVMTPDEGSMACGEFGPGRLPEPERIQQRIRDMLGSRSPDHPVPPKRSLAGRHILVTAGPTHEPIDPVRYLANRSSGKQGFAIATAAAHEGARVTLIAGPATLQTPAGVERIDVETASQMAHAVEQALPADCAIMVAAVADWRAREPAAHKLKKSAGAPPMLELEDTPDLLATLASHPTRPRLVIGFAAETTDLLEHASAKRVRKGADWIIANDVSGDVMGGEENEVHLLREDGVEHWPRASKQEVADRLVTAVARKLDDG